MKMNKADFVAYIAEKNDITKTDSKEMLDIITTALVSAIEEGHEVSLAGFGKFTVVERDERTARNPQTGEAMTVPAHKAPKFSFAKNIKDAIR